MNLCNELVKYKLDYWVIVPLKKTLKKDRLSYDQMNDSGAYIQGINLIYLNNTVVIVGQVLESVVQILS